MASYASDRSSLFGSLGPKKASAKPRASTKAPEKQRVVEARASSSSAAASSTASSVSSSGAGGAATPGRSAPLASAASSSKPVVDYARVDEASAIYDEAEALVTRPDDPFRRMMWKRDAAGAAAKYARAATMYASVGYAGPARDAFEKAAACHNESDSKHIAATELEHAARHACTLGSPGFDIRALLTNAANLWAANGETLRAAETLVRGATKLMLNVDDIRGRNAMLEEAADLADAATGTGLSSAPDVYKAALRFFCMNQALENAVDMIPRYVRALDAAQRDDDDPDRLRALAALTVIHLARGDVEAANGSFMDALGRRSYASSPQAAAVENLLVAVRSGVPDSMQQAQMNCALATLDAEVAALAASLVTMGRPPKRTASPPPSPNTGRQMKMMPPVAPEPEVPVDDNDDDDLPDIT